MKPDTEKLWYGKEKPQKSLNVNNLLDASDPSSFEGTFGVEVEAVFAFGGCSAPAQKLERTRRLLYRIMEILSRIRCDACEASVFDKSHFEAGHNNYM